MKAVKTLHNIEKVKSKHKIRHQSKSYADTLSSVDFSRRYKNTQFHRRRQLYTDALVYFRFIEHRTYNGMRILLLPVRRIFIEAA